MKKQLLVLCLALIALASLATAATVIRPKAGSGGGTGTVTASAGNLTANRLVVGAGGVDTAVLASLGTTSTLLHGNAAGLPTFGSVVLADISAAILSGNGAKLGTVTGTLTSGDCVKFDANGNLVANGSACGTGGTNALLDGTNHTDTLAGTVVRGDIICGNSTPKWARLALGGSGTVLMSNGTDCAWGSITPPTFAQITTGSNTGATMTCGTGCTITLSGSGVNNANQLNGTALSSLSSGCLSVTTGTGAVASSGSACGGSSTDTFVLGAATGITGGPVASTTYLLQTVGGLTADSAVWEFASGLKVPTNATLTKTYYSVWCNSGTLDNTHALTLKTYKLSGGVLTASTGASRLVSAIGSELTASETGLSVSYTAGDLVGWQMVVPVSWTGPSGCLMSATSYFTNP